MKENVPLRLVGYADADFAVCNDTRKASSGMVI